MNTIRNRGIVVLAGLAWSLICAVPALADDTDLFIGKSGGGAGSVKPNILLIIDTSGSMSTEVDTQEPYDPGTDYTGTCQDGRVYWRSGTGDPPSCSTSNWFYETALKCNAAISAFAAFTSDAYRS